MLGSHSLDCIGGKGSVDDGNVDSGLLKHCFRFLRSRGVRYGKRVGVTRTALCPSPAVAFELGGRWVEFLDAGHDTLLEAEDVLFEFVTKSRCHFGESAERRGQAGYQAGSRSLITHSELSSELNNTKRVR